MCNISRDKEYRTRSGGKVRLYCTDAGGDYPVHGAIYYEMPNPLWSVETWTSIGYSDHNDGDGYCDYDLVEYCQYSEFKQNDPVHYQNCNGDYWRIGHFSHVERGVPYIFKDGRTSFTASGNSPAKPVVDVKHLGKI